MSTTTTVRPTKKQRELLIFIERFINEHGYSPSYREIMTGLNYTSVATVALHINNLIKRGHLRKRDHSARSLEVTTPTTTPAQQAEAAPAEPAHHQWLIEQIHHFFVTAETVAKPSVDQVDQLYVLVGALRVLGLEEQAKNLAPRLAGLRQKVVEEAPSL